jgi:hypothetical protein
MNDLPALEKKLYALELEMMRPATRSSRASLEELIDEDFVAFASTGAMYDRESCISALLLERPQAWSIGGFQVRLLAPGVALATYVATTSAGPSSHRSTIWKLADGRWRMTFHQGTAVKD